MLLLSVFIIVVIVQICYYLFFLQLGLAKPYGLPKQTLPLSVVICAKNEADYLHKFLPFIAEQNYPKFEMVLVDDASEDTSLAQMHRFKKKYESNKLSIHILSISKEESRGKKHALSRGIELAKNEYLVLTDADCKPVHTDWLQEISKHFSHDISLILGYGAYQKIKKSFLNKIIRFETLLTAIQYFSYAKVGRAYMGVGRNMAYKKSEFKRIAGFSNHQNILSGDDDLLVNEIANNKNTAICFSRNSFTISIPETNFKQWIKQKRRHITTANHYKNIYKISLGIFYISQFIFLILAIVLLLLKILSKLVIALIIIRYIIWFIVLVKSAKKLNEKDLIRFAPILEFSIIFIQLYIFIKNLIAPPKYW